MASTPNPAQVASGATYLPPEETFQVLSSEPLIKFLTQAVQPPSSVYVAPGDSLQVSMASTSQFEVVTFTWRMLLPNRKIAYSQFQIPNFGNTNVPIVHTEPLPEGFLLSASATARIAQTRGVTFVRASITNPSAGSGNPSYMLMSDYLTNQIGPAHPNGRCLAPTEGPGNLKTALQNATGFPGNFVVPVPSNTHWRLIAFAGTLTTDGTPGNRTVDLSISDGIVQPFRLLPQAVQPPSTVVNYWATANAPNPAVSTSDNAWILPQNLILNRFMSISSIMFGAGPADQWGNLQMYVEEWLDDV